MRLADFDYELPSERIAKEPLPERSGSRLLCVTGDGLKERVFRELPALLKAGDLLVFNDTRVIPARLFGHKETGGRVEILIERVLNFTCALAQIRASKAPSPGTGISLEDGTRMTVLECREHGYVLEFITPDGASATLERAGHMPLPRYLHRPDTPADRSRYQTVYARVPGAIAAPTAGLHFDTALLDTIKAHGVQMAYVTLHVGYGTFAPAREDLFDTRRLHSECYTVTPDAVTRIAAARAQGGRVIAVGTTAVRALESASQTGILQPTSGETQLFISPGYRFQVVDALITNFHLPRSTLLMLVCAFGGYAPVMRAYLHAIDNGYRFYSYGDAMWVERRDDVYTGVGK